MATRRSPRRENLAKNRNLEKGPAKSEDEKPKSRVTKLDIAKPDDDEVEDEPQPGPSVSKRREKSKRKSSQDGEKVRTVKEDEEEDPSYASAMLLDVLAQVASDRLETEPPRGLLPGQKLSKRMLSTLDILSLEHILQLNDKLLIQLFSELTSNEMSRNYSFQCLLMPDKCKATFSSYGNELRSKNLMLAHLKQHIKKLVKESEECDSFKFAAEPVHARKKRLTAEKSLIKRVWSKSMRKTVLIQNKNLPAEAYMMSTGRGGSKKTKASATITSAEEYAEEFSPPLSKKQRHGSGSLKKGKRHRSIGDEVMIEESDPGDIDVEGSNTPLKAAGDDEPSTSRQVEKTIEENEQFIIDLLRRTQPYQDHSYTTVFGARHFQDTNDPENLDDDTEGPSARTAGLTSLNYEGGWEGTNNTTLTESGEASSLIVTDTHTNRHVIMKIGSGTEQGTVTNAGPSLQHVPIIRVTQPGAPADNMPIVSAEEVVPQEGVGDTDRNEDMEAAMELIEATTSVPKVERRYRATGRKSQYPPMPKSDLARQGRVQVIEEMLSSDDEDNKALAQAAAAAAHGRSLMVVGRQRNRKLPQLLRSDGTTDWERRMALKCIRELRLRKREDGALNCKICENKSFTATATLMYHYRSHAGIKPFVCLICNTTFTRQHSLNYHMLIHNNQSRFTCKDCGRKFRHPSHFKEHMRRHTGETPFHCSDCPLRFKTRNTYKRHLRTRHNKLLTADGVRFTPYNPGGIRLSLKSQKHVEEASDEDDGSEEEEEEEEVEMDEEEVHHYSTVDGSNIKVETEPAVQVTHIDADGNMYQAVDGVGIATTSDGQALAPVVLQDVPPENSASNRLLQFCSQVVSQEAG